MRIFLAILSGFVLTLAVYGGGIITAIFFLDAEPIPDPSRSLAAAELWTNEPVAVSTPAQDLDRITARPARVIPDDARQAEAKDIEPVDSDDFEVERADPRVDTITTASVSSDAAPQPPTRVVSAAHLAWCMERYRSYRPSDDSYTPYSGGRRKCVSPFSEAPAEASGYLEASVDRPFVGYAIDDEPSRGHLTPEHVRSCFDRYRSYRAEDNTYQPYGGGPRRQCR